MEKKYYVTTPIYYVNAEPHIGHAYSTIVADFLKRFYQMRGFDSYFLTGTDEHGDKIYKTAKNFNKSPQEYSDEISDKFKKTWKDLEIKNDDFIRTTENRHKEVVQKALQKVYDKGDIYYGSYSGNYCVGCERFLTEKEIVDGKCPEHNKPVETIEEHNYFFKMKKYQQWLIDHIKNNPDFIRPERYKNEVLAILNNEELEDLCISRPKDRVPWGIELPFDENFVTYVWFDALINYISALGYPDGEKFKNYWPVVNHIIAKDIVKPHGVFWPTMLKAMDIEPYLHLNVHGYWNMKNMKMSKSLGNVVTPSGLINKYGNDQIRYFLLREMTFGLDANFTEEAIIDRVNFDLANDLGNLINRSFNMVNKYFDNKIPDRSSKDCGFSELREKIDKSINGYFDGIDNLHFHNGLESLWEFIRNINKYIDEYKPWQLSKEGKTEELSSVIRNILESIYSIAVLISPICITSCEKIYSALAAEKASRDIDKIKNLNSLNSGSNLNELGILFPKMEKEESPAEQNKNTGKNKTKNESDQIEIGDFLKIDLRVSKILKAEKVEGSEKLLRLQIDTGLDERQIVAGVAQKYSPEEMTGKKIIVVSNLKPAVIFKQESNGMLLAGKKDKKDLPQVIFVDDSVPVGSKLG